MPQVEKPASANTRCSITRFASLGLLFPFFIACAYVRHLGYNSACTYGCGILGLFLFGVYRVVLVIGRVRVIGLCGHEFGLYGLVYPCALVAPRSAYIELRAFVAFGCLCGLLNAFALWPLNAVR